MFYTSYLSSNLSFEELSEVVQHFFSGHDEIIRSAEDELSVSSQGFTLRLTKGGNNVAFASEDYATSFDYCLWFEIISSYKDWADDLMRFTNYLLERSAGDYVLEANGDKPILLRQAGELYIDPNIGDGSFPFHLISLPYAEKSLMRQDSC